MAPLPGVLDLEMKMARASREGITHDSMKQDMREAFDV